MKLPILKKWFMVQLSKPVIMAKIYEHDSILDGSEFQSEGIVDIDTQNHILICENGKMYKLGEPDPVWVKHARF